MGFFLNVLSSPTISKFAEHSGWQGGSAATRLSVAVSGDLAVVASQADGSLTILDVGDPARLNQSEDYGGGPAAPHAAEKHPIPTSDSNRPN